MTFTIGINEGLTLLSRHEKTNSNKLVYCILLFPREISLRVNTRNLEDFHATLQSGWREEIVHFQIVMQHLFTTASDQSNWSSRAIQSCQRKRATSFEWQGPVISRNSSSDDTRSTLVASLENCAQESRDLMKDTCLDIYTICFQKRVR